MTSDRPAPARQASRFASAHARADHWGLAAKACLEGVAAAAAGADLGILYASEAFSGDLPSILTFLRETTRIRTWVGGAAPGVLEGGEEIREGGGLAVMVGSLSGAASETFSCLDLAGLGERLSHWAAGDRARVALVHGDPRNPGLPALVEAAAAQGGYLVGGLVSSSGPPTQVADTVVSGGLSGLLLDPSVEVVSGVTQGCSPLGATHEVTEAWEGVIMALDGRPALDVLRDEAGELIARDVRRAAGYIHVGLPVPGSDRGDYVVRTLVGIDPRQGWLAVGDRIEVGRRVMFVRRDPNSARADLARMLAGVRERLGGRRALAAIYVSCIARGRFMFGQDGAETALVRQALGEEVPLIGFFANGEIAGDRVYGFTGVLAVIPEPPPEARR